MKLNSLLILTGMILSLLNIAHAESQGEILFDQKCSMCHSKTFPKDINAVVAPAVMGVMRHVKIAYPNKSDAVAFIKDYALNPSEEKAICMPQKIKRFGLMPSQKGNVTEEELSVIASWMFDNFPKRGMGQGYGQQKGLGRQ